MKDYLQIKKDRTKYHIQPHKNTVHRSSLLVPVMPKCEAWIGFINHFLIRRGYKSIALKISSINKLGDLLDSTTLEINEPKVYSFNLTKIFSKFKTANYLIEFFSEKNLFIPFPAVVITHWGKDFCNTVHSYNRVLNDIFENDQINKKQVSEASFDLVIDKKYDTFFNISSGILRLKNSSLFLSYQKNNLKINKKINVSMPRLSHKSLYLSKIFLSKLNGGIVRIKQPKQNMFYGRLLVGRINKKTKAFSANHSFYDSSKEKEYFSSSESLRTYPYFNNISNKITIYPILSPCKLNFRLKIFSNNGFFLSKDFKFSSPSSKPCSIDVNKFVESRKLQNVTAFTLIATSNNSKIPTRVNHQLIYGQPNSNNALQCSINVSLTNRRMFNRRKKETIVWGQFINHKDYRSKIGFCFNLPEGKSEKVNIDFYNFKGKFKSKKQILNPSKSFIINSDEILNTSKKPEFCWFIAKSKRLDLNAYAIHQNIASGNFSGEHNF